MRAGRGETARTEMRLTLRTGDVCEFDPGHLLDVFATQRRQFIQVLQGFGPQDWAEPTRCADWSAQDVVRHLCDVTPLIAAKTGDRSVDTGAGFDPRATPRRWLAGSAGESPDATLRRLRASTEEGLCLARARLDNRAAVDVGMPYGPADSTVLALHILWDSWVHERDVLLRRDTGPAADAGATADVGATGYAVAYGLFIAVTTAAQFGDRICDELTLSGDGGGTFALDNRRDDAISVVRMPAARPPTTGPSAAEVADALAGRIPVDAALDGVALTTRTALARLAVFFNTPVRRRVPPGPAVPAVPAVPSAGRQHG